MILCETYGLYAIHVAIVRTDMNNKQLNIGRLVQIHIGLQVLNELTRVPSSHSSIENIRLSRKLLNPEPVSWKVKIVRG